MFATIWIELLMTTISFSVMEIVYIELLHLAKIYIMYGEFMKVEGF